MRTRSVSAAIAFCLFLLIPLYWLRGDVVFRATAELPNDGKVIDDLAGACKALVDEANFRGGEDNITVVLARAGHELYQTVFAAGTDLRAAVDALDWVESLPVHIAAPAAVDPSEVLPRPLIKRSDRSGQFAIVAGINRAARRQIIVRTGAAFLAAAFRRAASHLLGPASGFRVVEAILRGIDPHVDHPERRGGGRPGPR